jgi:hypothetical protein
MLPIIVGIGIGLSLLLMHKPKNAAAATPAAVKLPTATSPGSVTIALPPAVEIPETTITAAPADTSLLLTADEQSTLMSNDANRIYEAASNSTHEAFVAYAGVILAGKGDARAPVLVDWLKNWHTVVGPGGTMVK